MKKTKIARAIACAIAGTALTAGAVSNASAAGTANYNAFNHDRSAPNYLVGGNGSNPPGSVGTDGWLRTADYDPDGEFDPEAAPPDNGANPPIYLAGHSWADGPATGNSGLAGASVAWVGTDPRTTTGNGGFGYTGTQTLNWSATLGALGDSVKISNVASSAAYGGTVLADGTTFNQADIDTAKGAWYDDKNPGTGWRHDTDIGLFRSDVTTDVLLSVKSLGPENLNAQYGFTVFQGKDTKTTGSYNHHAGWHGVSIATADGVLGSGPSEAAGVDITPNNPFGGAGLTVRVLDDVLNNNAYFTAQAGQIYTIYLGGFKGGDWTVTRDNYELTISSVPLPGAVWLFGSAIAGMGMAGLRKKKAAASG